MCLLGLGHRHGGASTGRFRVAGSQPASAGPLGQAPFAPDLLASVAFVPDPAADVDQLVRRLRGLSARAWASGGRRDAVRRLCAELLALGEPGHVLPELPDHGLGDAVAVLSHEALRYQATQRNGRRDEVAAAVRRALEATK